ncbi:hypothetical protein AZH11_03820 [Pseudomonas simiae]|nr:hypothetical protein AZH11_03820 [Pseudomonas simiae]
MLEARKHKVAIEGVDASSSYHMEHVLELSDAERFIPRSSKYRNFYSHKALAQKNDEGWIALVSHDRIGSSDELPGLADLQNVVALRVDDVAPGQPVGIVPDTSVATLSRGDYKLTMAPGLQALPTPGPLRLVQVSTSPSHYNAFDLPASFKHNLDEMVYMHRAFDSRYGSQPGSPNVSAFEAFKNTRERLDKTAREAFAAYTPPARPDFTDLATAASEEAFVEKLFKLKLGLIIGEAHIHKSSKRFLIKYMKMLKKQGVKTLYVEHLLTDLHQAALEEFFNTLKMPENLKRYLRAQDRGHMRGYSGDDTYTNVINAANKEGIRVRALDCTASYHTKGMRGRVPRETMFSYFANEVIKADQAALGPHRWVALMGNAHADMFQGVPGIAQLQDAVSLTVRDVAPDSARPLHRGAWEIFDKGTDSPGSVAVRSDFKIDVGIDDMRPPQARALPDRTRLRAIGNFHIERPSETQVNLVHHSNSGDITVTPIQIDDKGQLFIERWPQLKDKRYLTLEQFIEALKTEVHLTAVS